MAERPFSDGADRLMNQYYPVLDHGFVALVDYMGNDQAIEHAARVSYGKGTRARSKTRGLIRYLMNHKHTTPLEMVEVKLHAAMPMFVARQWIRHRTASVNEYSGRYSLIPNVTYRPEGWRLQSGTNAQGSEGFADQLTQAIAFDRHDDIINKAFDTYDWMEEHEIARELSRIDLPLSSYTQWYWKIDLHNLLHFLRLRSDPHAQWEIRVFSDIIAGIVKEAFPLTYEAWVDYSMRAASFSRMELELLREMLFHGLQNFEALNYSLFDMTEREGEEFRAKLQYREPFNPILPDPLTQKQAFARLFPEEEFNLDS